MKVKFSPYPFLFLSFLGYSTLAVSETVTVPNTFVPGQILESSKLNNNFSELATGINENNKELEDNTKNITSLTKKVDDKVGNANYTLKQKGLKVYDKNKKTAEIGTDIDKSGKITTYNQAGETLINLESDEGNGSGQVVVRDALGQVALRMRSFPLNKNDIEGSGSVGHIQIFDTNTKKTTVAIAASAAGNGLIATYNTVGNNLVTISSASGTQSGMVVVNDRYGRDVVKIFGRPIDENDPEAGSIGVIHVFNTKTDTNSTPTFITGNSIGSAIKNFVEPHPLDDTKNIVYAATEGPEAAMYIRGTATLSEGYAQVDLPEHFYLLASEHGLTADMTPRSIDGRGLAIIDLTPQSLEVGELYEGKGNYSFDYTVYAVRKRYEDYVVVRDKE